MGGGWFDDIGAWAGRAGLASRLPWRRGPEWICTGRAVRARSRLRQRLIRSVFWA